MSDLDLNVIFKPIWEDVLESEQYNKKHPLLAHYTTLEAFESIISRNQIWFSNPLLTNDYDEVRFGINAGLDLVRNNDQFSDAFMRVFSDFYNEFASDHALDTYVFSLSEHDPANYDGRLSMWRGYGGNGGGVAFVFSSDKVPVIESSPLIAAKVKYASKDTMINDLKGIISKFYIILSNSNITDGLTRWAAAILFNRIKHYALFSKHQGFEEEKEWRIVYSKSHDREQKLTHMYDCCVTSRGLEPKLKLTLSPIEGVLSARSIAEYIDRIIIGPSTSSPITRLMTQRMVEKYGYAELKEKVFLSSIPFRAI